MFNFFKKNILYIMILVIILELLSCIITDISFESFLGLICSFVFSILIFFLNCIVLKKGFISDKDVFVLFGIGLISLVCCMISFIKKDNGYTFLSLLTSIFFIVEFFLIKKFDIKKE